VVCSVYLIILIRILISIHHLYYIHKESREIIKMPASSRKRNKGKERKAKKEESKRMAMYNTWHDWARGDMGNMGLAGVIQCNHGIEKTIPDLYPIPF